MYLTSKIRRDDLGFRVADLLRNGHKVGQFRGVDDESIVLDHIKGVGGHSIRHFIESNQKAERITYDYKVSG